MAVVVVVWLLVSFSPQGRARGILEWLGATLLYVALGALFLNLVLEARESGSLLGQIAFGFLLLVFGIGLCVSLVNTLRALSGPAAGEGGDGATH